MLFQYRLMPLLQQQAYSMYLQPNTFFTLYSLLFHLLKLLILETLLKPQPFHFLFLRIRRRQWLLYLNILQLLKRCKSYHNQRLLELHKFHLIQRETMHLKLINLLIMVYFLQASQQMVLDLLLAKNDSFNINTFYLNILLLIHSLIQYILQEVQYRLLFLLLLDGEEFNAHWKDYFHNSLQEHLLH